MGSYKKCWKLLSVLEHMEEAFSKLTELDGGVQEVFVTLIF